MARGGVRLVHGHTKITYFSGMKINPKYAFLHAFFLICPSCPFQNLSILARYPRYARDLASWSLFMAVSNNYVKTTIPDMVMIMTLSSFLQDIVLQLLRDRFRFLGILNVVFVNYYYIMIEITCCPCKRLCCVCLMIYVKFSQPAHPLFTFSLFHFLSL